jgi:hypothetical protein
MSSDFLEQLAMLEVREPPPEFDRKLHQRVNRALLIQHLLSLAMGSVPWAALHFLRGFVGVVLFSITGRFDDELAKKNSESK